MRDFVCAELDMRVCDEGHVHINLKAYHDADCPILGIALNAADAREMAMQLLEAANAINPPQ